MNTSIDNLIDKIKVVPENPYGQFSDKDRTVLAEASEVLCGNDERKKRLLAWYVRAFVRNTENETAYENAGADV